MDPQPQWNWSSLGDASASPQPTQPTPTQTSHQEPPPPEAQPSSQQRRRYGPRTCRICLDVEEPKFPEPGRNIFGVSSTSTRPAYVSDDPELGRLLSPCKCKGSQKYVHEGCLNAWRQANPTEARNFWQCPTCKFTYRMARLNYASALSSKWARVGLTVVLLVFSIFFLGFIADPLFDMWMDPLGVITETVANVVTDIEAMREPPREAPSSWAEHFTKGFFSLGIVGLVRSMLTWTPLEFLYFRSNTGAHGRRRGGTGRGRVENLHWGYVLLGAVTFLMGLWKAVNAFSSRVLKNMSDRVLDVGADDDEDEDDGAESRPESKKDE